MARPAIPHPNNLMENPVTNILTDERVEELRALAATERHDLIDAHRSELARLAKFDNPTNAQVERCDVIADELDVLERAERRDFVRAAMQSGNLHSESGFGGRLDGTTGNRTTDPWSQADESILRTESAQGLASRAHTALERVGDAISDDTKEMLAQTIDTEGGAAAAFVIARSNPHYLSAFTKVIRNPERGMLTFTADESRAFGAVEAVRSTMLTSVGTAGYLIPLSLDPNVAAIVNNGIAAPFRARASVKTTISSPARTITSTGITAQWLAEGAAAADASPTFVNVDIPLFKLSAYVSASYELLQDAGPEIVAQLGLLLGDARNRAEGQAFVDGDGTTAPQGLVAQVAAAAASTVTATTRGSFTSASSVDVFNIYGALPARARQADGMTWVSNVGIANIIRQQSPNGQGSTFIATMADGVARGEAMFGAPYYEASGMSAATTSGSTMLVGGDFHAYRIVDHLAGPALEFVPVVIDQATGRPNGTRGWFYTQRTGAKCLDVTQFRFLKS